MRATILCLTLCSLCGRAWAGDPAQYNLVQSQALPKTIDAPLVVSAPRSYVLTIPAPEFQAQLDRIEQMLRAVCSAYTVRLENAPGTLAGCPKK